MADEDLRALVAGQVLGSCDFPDGQRDQLLNQIRQRYGRGVLAVLIYGSYLRGKRDTLLDFYVLLDSYGSMPKAWQGWLAKALPPNVYQIHHGTPPDEIRAKYALLSLDRFEYAVRRDYHSYFWARFAQPCGILYCRDEETRSRVIEAICQSTRTFVRRVTPRLPEHFDSKQLWATGLSLTYQCEFRSEPPGHAESCSGIGRITTVPLCESWQDKSWVFRLLRRQIHLPMFAVTEPGNGLRPAGGCAVSRERFFPRCAFSKPL